MYLLDAVSPALPDSIPGPHIMGIFCQLVHHRFLRWGEFNEAQVHWGRLIPTCQLVTTKQNKRNISLAFLKKSKLKNPYNSLFNGPNLLLMVCLTTVVTTGQQAWNVSLKLITHQIERPHNLGLHFYANKSEMRQLTYLSKLRRIY